MWAGLSMRICFPKAMRRTWSNKSPEPTAPSSVAELLRRTGVGAVSSAVALHAASRRWLSSFQADHYTSPVRTASRFSIVAQAILLFAGWRMVLH